MGAETTCPVTFRGKTSTAKVRLETNVLQIRGAKLRLDVPFADMKNVGPREGGSITAAQFIQRFIENGVRWAHVDMAGKAWSDKPSATYDKGATGYGVRLLDEYVAEVLEA